MKRATTAMIAAFIVLFSSLPSKVGGKACFFTPSTKLSHAKSLNNDKCKQQHPARRAITFGKMTERAKWQQQLILSEKQNIFSRFTKLAMATDNDEGTAVIDENEKERLLNEIKLLTDSFGNVQEKIRTNAKIYEERISFYESKISEMEEINDQIILQLKGENEQLKEEVNDTQTNSSNKITMERTKRLQMEQLLNQTQVNQTRTQKKCDSLLKERDNAMKNLQINEDKYNKERAHLSSQIEQLKQNTTMLHNDIHILNMQRIEETNSHGLLLGNVTQHLSELLVKEANWNKEKENLLVMIENMEQDFNELANEKSKLMDDKTEFACKLTELTTQTRLEKKKLSSHIQKLEEIVSDLKSKKEKLKTQLDAEAKSHESKLAETTSELSDAIKENDILKNDRHHLTQKLKNMNAEWDAQQKKINSMTTSMNDIQWTYKMSQKQNEMEKAALLSRITDLQQNVANLTQEVGTLVDNRVKESTEHSKKVEKITKGLDAMSDEQILWLSERDDLLNEKAQLEIEKNELSKEIDRATKLRDDGERSLKANAAEYEAERKNLMLKVAQLEEDTAALTENIGKREAQWKSNIIRSESKLDEITLELSTALKLQADWQSEKDSLIQERENLAMEVETMARERDDLIASIDRSMENMEKSLKEKYGRRNEEAKIGFEDQIKKLEEKNMDMAREIIELMTKLRQQKDPEQSRSDHHSISDRNDQNNPNGPCYVKKSPASSNSKTLSDLGDQIKTGKDPDKNIDVGSHESRHGKEDVVVEVNAKESRWNEKAASEKEKEWEDELENNIPLIDAIFCGYKSTEEEKSRLKSAHLDDADQL